MSGESPEYLALASFVRARLDEDERVVRLVERSSLGDTPTSGRGTRDLAFKRWLVDRYERGAGYGSAMERLAEVYADHPDNPIRTPTEEPS